MRLRRFLDAQYAEGREDGSSGRRPNPGITEYEPRRGRWAYNAGYQDGQRDLEQLRTAVLR